MINRIKNSVRVRGLRLYNYILGYHEPPKLTKIKVDSFGNEYGFSYAPKDFLNEKSNIVSFGAGEDITCEVEMTRKFNCQINIYDPTPRSLKHFDDLVLNTKNGSKTLINNNPDQTYDATEDEVSRLSFHPLGIWDKDTQISFFVPKIKEHVSHSIMQDNMSEESITVDVKCLGSIMKDLDLEEIDYLKFDIEGAEYSVLDEILRNRYKIKVFYVEFHYLDKDPILSKCKINKCLKKMKNAGFIPTEYPDCHELLHLFVREDIVQSVVIK